ncbi:MAG: 1-phosphofructokinase family hexose kinase [Actinomycetota bacterium]
MLVASPNLTTDRIVRTDELRPGEVQRFSEATILPGGKGVNVVRAARLLGYPAVLVALAPGRTGRAVVEMVRDEGLEVVPVETGGEVRAASVIFERGGRVTVLNEPGPQATEGDWRRYQRAVEERLGGHRFLVCVGSTPPGIPPEAYGRLTALARDRTLAVLVDATGELLAAALEAGPDIVTPNVAEAETVLLGTTAQPVDQEGPDAGPRALEAAAALIALGARRAVVTAGRAGVAVADGSETWWVDAPAVEVRNPIGAGDTLVGVLVGKLERGAGFPEAVRAAVAGAAASVETEVPGILDPGRARALAAEIGA